MVSFFEKTVSGSEPIAVKPLPTGKSGALVATYHGGLRAVIKPVKDTMPDGKRRQRGISVRTHPSRERAFYKLAQLIGFDDLVPETVIIQYKGAEASAQIFTPAQHLRDINPKLKDVHAPGWRQEVVQTALMVPKRYWRRLLALDLIAGARDRHANNIGVQLKLVDEQPVYRLVAWDNAVTFGLTFAKYHNIFHKFIFRNKVDFDDVWSALEGVTLADLDKTLNGLLSTEEIEHAYKRLTFIRDDFPYRLPWKVCSGGSDDSGSFPSYDAYFSDSDETPLAVSA